MTFAVIGDASVELVSVEAGAADLILPESVSYEGTDYVLAAIAPYAFYLSGATDVELPATIADVDDRAFRSSEVSSVEVAEGNPTYSSFDGALYDADLTRLLLIPGGRQGAVRIPSQASDVPASAFSHCALVTAIDADAGGAAYSSWEGLLYDAGGTTLIRVPAGATDITIREGCTSIAAGAMEGCASLERINAPASVTSISPDVFANVPTVSLLAASVVADSAADAGEGSDDSAPEASDPANVQLSAMVALSSADDDLPAVDPAAVAISLPAGADAAPWRAAGFSADDPQDEAAGHDEAMEGIEGEEGDLPVASLGSASTYAGAYDITIVNAEGSTLYQTNSSGSTNTQIDSKVISCGDSSHQVHVRFLNKGGSLIVQLWHSAATDNSYYRWVKPGYVLVGVKVTNGAGTVSDEIRATEVGTSYKGASAIKGVGRTIAPIFEKVTYTVPLDKAGGTGGSDSVANVQYGSAMPAITPPTKAGYAFMGYYWSSNGSGTQYYDQSGKSVHVWDRCVTYPTSLSTSVTLDSSYKLVAYWRDSCTFDAGGGTLSVYGSHSSTGTPLQSNLSSYTAIWDTNRPTAVYGGASDRCGQFTSYATGQPTAVYANRKGYTFLGWKTSTGTLINSGSQQFARGVTYTAQWGGPYTATFNAGTGATLKVTVAGVGSSADGSKTDGQVIAQNVTSYTASWSGANCIYSSGVVHFWVTSNGYMYQVTPVRFGYTHTGWTGSATINSTTGNKVIEPGGTYTAQWGGPYSCTFDAGGGTLDVYSSLDLNMKTPDKKVQGGLSVFTATWGAGTATAAYGSSVERVGHFTNTSGQARAVYAERPGYTFLGWKVGNETISSGSKPFVPGATYKATWTASVYTISFNPNGGTGGQSAQVKATYGSALPAISTSPPKREGYNFIGWYDDADYTKGTQYYTASGASAKAYDKPKNCTLYAAWSSWPTVELDANGGNFSVRVEQEDAAADGSHYVGEVVAQGQERWSADYENSARVYANLVHYWRSGYLYSVNPTRTGYHIAGWTGSHVVNESTGSVGVNAGDHYQCQWEGNSYTIAFDAQCDLEVPAMQAIYDQDVTLPAPSERKGYIFQGWNTKADGTGAFYRAQTLLSKPNFVESGTINLYAQWVPSISVDVPIEVTAQVDLLGIEDQVPASGYIESRCGAPLAVEEVSFTALAGAADLFGEANTASVSLQALALEGDASWDASTPTFSFPLSADATESDASKLAALRMEAYEDHIPIGYRFAIPEDVLASIDPARFEKVTTPVCSVVYTVALAN